jgi:hypothetical protein
MGVLVPRLHYTFFQAGTWSLEEEGNQKKGGLALFFFWSRFSLGRPWPAPWANLYVDVQKGSGSKE